MSFKKSLEGIVRRIPGAAATYRALIPARFVGSRDYWENRYAEGGTSGTGSYGPLALFKAEVLNEFVRERGVQSVLEFGCGDGSQLSLAKYPSYIGLDVSPSAIRRCIDRFGGDPDKSFFVYDCRAFQDHRRVFKSDLVLSLDVIFHLVEFEIYDRYLTQLFAAADRLVVIYSSNQDLDNTGGRHERHRRFTDWTSQKAVGWRLVLKVDNRYPYEPARSEETSLADFYVFERTPSG